MPDADGSRDLLIYGANGYTGRLVAEQCVARGLRPMLAGRDEAAVGALARTLGLRFCAFPLEDDAAIRAGLHGVRVVLHCAGPFVRTSAPMVDACLAAGVHYLDVTGELAVFEAIAPRDAEAKRAGVVLLPGTGFDVVPSDCLAAHLARRLPDATRLELAFEGMGGVSRGSATTMIENLGSPGAVRREGRIVPVPPAYRERTVDFGRGPRVVVSIPWGDVSTAWHSTGIPDITVFMAMTPAQRRALRWSRHIGWLLATGAVKRRLLARVRRGPAGPSANARRRGTSRFWGEATAADGRRVAARLLGAEGYTLTAQTAVACAERVLAGAVAAGFHTPSRAFGPDFVLELGMTREDLAPGVGETVDLGEGQDSSDISG